MSVRRLLSERSVHLYKTTDITPARIYFSNLNSQFKLFYLLTVASSRCIQFESTISHHPLDPELLTHVYYYIDINLLTSNVNYSGRTAPLTPKVAFYIFIQQI